MIHDDGQHRRPRYPLLSEAGVPSVASLGQIPQCPLTSEPPGPQAPVTFRR